MTVFLTILKAVGVLLTAVLCILLTCVLLALFVPVRYSAEGAYQERFWAKIRVTWLIHFVSVKVSFGEGFAYSVKMAGIRLLPKKEKRKEEKREAAPKNAGQPEEAVEKEAASEIADRQEALTKSEAEGQEMTAAAEENRHADKAAPEAEDDIHEEDGEENGFWGLPEKILEKIYVIFGKTEDKYEAIRVKIEKVKEKISRYVEILKREETRQLFGLASAQLLRMAGHILPRNMDICLRIGTGDPASTGQILALQGMLYPVLRNRVRIVPDFEEKHAEGAFYLKGHITAFALLLCALRVVINRNFRKLIRILRKKEEA